MKPKILLAGKNGQVGAELERLLGGPSELLAVGHEELDLADPDSIRRAIKAFGPHLIINAAAFTAVDQAEEDSARAHAVNALGPTIIAEEAKQIGAALIHFSTDYVFDGKKNSPYTEDDVPNPINIYGQTKLDGERGIQGAGATHLIFRTSWVYGTRGRNFLLTILRLATQRRELRIVADQMGAPTWSREIALATTKIITEEWERCEANPVFSKCSGIYHMSAAGQTTWWEFAEAIVKEARHSQPHASWLTTALGGRPLIVDRISPITTAEYLTPARRPEYSVLSNECFARTFGMKLPDWRSELRAAFQSA
jgi:dTDP-4-dehydrorhamnose reductase